MHLKNMQLSHARYQKAKRKKQPTTKITLTTLLP